MKATTKSKIAAKPAKAPKQDTISARISLEAYRIITEEAKLTRRSFRNALDMMLGV